MSAAKLPPLCRWWGHKFQKGIVGTWTFGHCLRCGFIPGGRP